MLCINIFLKKCNIIFAWCIWWRIVPFVRRSQIPSKVPCMQVVWVSAFMRYIPLWKWSPCLSNMGVTLTIQRRFNLLFYIIGMWGCKKKILKLCCLAFQIQTMPFSSSWSHYWENRIFSKDCTESWSWLDTRVIGIY